MEVAGVARRVVLEVVHQAVPVVVHLADQAQMEVHRADLAVVPLAGLVVVHGL